MHSKESEKCVDNFCFTDRLISREEIYDPLEADTDSREFIVQRFARLFKLISPRNVNIYIYANLVVERDAPRYLLSEMIVKKNKSNERRSLEGKGTTDV